MRAWRDSHTIVGMTGDQPELRTVRTSGATAEVAPFADDAALLQALLDAVTLRAKAAIAHRQWLGLLSRRGDAAATLFLDGDRIDGLLDGPAGPPPADALALAVTAEHAVDAFAARAAATDEATGSLARALRRWQLDPASTLLLGALLAAELSPRLGRVLAYVGGDASRAGVTVDAAAALLSDGVPGALAVEAALGAGAPLFELGLAAARPLDQPLLRRTIALAPRVAQLARGVLALDPLLAHAVAPVAPAAVAPPPALAAAIDAVLRGSPPVIGLVRAARDASAAERIAAVAARRGMALWRIDVRALADEGIERAVVREARLLGAALIVRIEPPGPGRESWRVIKLLDRLAGRVPTLVDADERADVEPAWASPVVPIELGALDGDERAAAWIEALGPTARLAELDRARRIRIPIDGMRRAAGALAALSGAGARGPLLPVAIAQVMREPALARVARRGLAELVLPATVRDRVAGVCEAARRSERMVIALVGRPGTGKTALAAAIAGALDAAALALDYGRLADRPAELDRSLAEAMAFAAAGGVAVIDASDPVPPRRGFTAGPELDLLVRRLAAATGAVVLLARESSAIDPVVRRWIHELIEVPPLDAAGREAMWRRALDGAPDPAAAVHALRELPLSASQILRVAERALASGATAPDALRAEAQRMAREAGG